MKNNATKKALSLLMAALMVFSVLSPLPARTGSHGGVTKAQAAGQGLKADSWSDLRNEISGAQSDVIEIEITNDIVADGGTINISDGKTVTIKAEAGKYVTIWRKDGDANFPMFQTSNENAKLILGEGITLSGKTCSPKPAVGEFKAVFHNGGSGDKAKQTDPEVMQVKESIVKDPADIASGWAPKTGLVFKGWKFIGPDGKENNTSNNIPNTSTGNWKVPADKYGTMTLVAQWEEPSAGGSGVMTTSDGRKLVVDKSTKKLQLHNIAEDTEFTEILSVEIQSDGKIKASSESYPNEWLYMKGYGIPYLEKSPNGNTYIYAHSDTEGTVATASSNTIYLKSTWPNAYLTGYGSGTWSIDGTPIASSIGGSGGGTSSPYTSITTPDFVVSAGSGGQGCDGEKCKIYTSTDFSSGTTDAPRGFFVQVDKGTVTLAGATLKNFNTNNQLSYVAPVVANGGTFNVSSGSIEQNSVGYSADNSKSGDSAAKIGKEAEDGKYGEKGYIGQWANTETAGAIIYTNHARGTISGGEIKNNRGDTGAILVQGKADKQGGTETCSIENGSYLDIKGGHIDNNAGVHHAGALYIFNGADVKMTGGTLNNNFSWNKGGAVWVSEEAYASVLWNQNPNYNGPHMKSVGYAGFTLDGKDAEISNNMTINRGGAINVMSNHVKLINGTINNNASRVLGGAIYVEGDGTDRMYTMVVNKGCIAGNTAYTQNNAQNGTLNRVFGTDSGECGFVNDITAANAATTNNNNVTRSADFGGYSGYGGGIWMCSFGGNATFNASDSFDVKVNGNTAQTRGQDLHVHVLKGGSTNGVNIMKLGNNNFYIEGTNIKLQENQNYQGITSVENKDNMQTCDGGVVIEGNQATVGGGIAANGTVIFGDDVNVYEATTNLKITKSWEKEELKDTVHLKLYVKYNGERVAITDDYDPLKEYEVTLDGTPDTLVEDGTEPGEGEYNQNSGVWEASPGYVANIGLPMMAVLSDGTRVPLFKLQAGSELLDPSKPEDLKKLYNYLAGGGQITTADVTDNWNIEVVETIDGEEVSHELPLGNVAVDRVEARPAISRDYKDRTGKVLTTFSTYPMDLHFKTEVLNTEPKEETPGPEKYINKVVHTSLPAFDEKFEYAVLAYVPKDATEVVLTDTLEAPLEFVNKTKDTVLSGFYVLAENDHKGDGNGTVATTPRDKVSGNTLRVANGVKNGNRAGTELTLDVDGNTVTLTLKEQFLQGVATADNDAIFKQEGKDRDYVWVMMTFDAQYNKDYYDLAKVKDNTKNGDSWLENADDKSGGAALTYVQNNAEVRQNANTNKYIIKLGDKYYNSSDAKTWADVTTGASYYIPRWDGNGNPKFNKLEGSAILDVTGIAIPSEAGITANGFVKDATETHSGTKNQAEYKLTRGNNPASEYKTNIVTVDAPMTKLEAEKKWKNADGSDITWPEGVTSVEVDVIRVDKATQAEERVDTIKLTKAESKKQSKELPKLNNATYRLEEVTVDGYTTASADMAAADLTEGSESGKVFTNTKKVEEKPEIEKFVKEAVHKDITFDEVFTYDIVAYVTKDAEKVTITDTLDNVLTFVTAANQVAVYDLGTTNNHKVTYDVQAKKVNNDATVAGGTVYEGATSHIDEQTLTVIITDATALQGHWIKVRFTAKIKEGLTIADLTYREVKGNAVNDFDANRAKPNQGNAPVKAGADHTGVPNKAEYDIEVGNAVKYSDSSNTVTVKPKTTKVEVKKDWVLNGETQDKWPEGATVEVKLTKNGQVAKDAKGNEITAVLSEDKKSVTFDNLPILQSVTYGVKEGTVTNAGSFGFSTVKEEPEGVFTLINKAEQPSIEKYVNKKDAEPADKDNTVHTDLSFFDEVYTYDILAFVTEDAKYMVVTDQLKEVLELVNTDSIKVVQKDGAGDDGKTAPALSSTEGQKVLTKGTDYTISTANNKLTVSFGNERSTLLLPSAGKWIQITFDAKIKDEYRSIEALKAKGADVWTEVTENVTDNGTRTLDNADVTEEFSGATADSHEGIINDATYTINKKAGAELDNAWQYECKSNTVTVQPDVTELTVTKTWKDANGKSLTEWPKVEGIPVAVKVQLQMQVEGTAPVNVKDADGEDVSVTLTSSDPYTFQNLPKLENTKYLVEETAVDVNGQVYTPTVTYNYDTNVVTIANQPEKPEIEKFVEKVKPHYNLAAYDQVYVYDVVMYVPSDATKIEMSDKLNALLELVIDSEHPVTASVAAAKGIQKGTDITSLLAITKGENKGAELLVSIEKISATSSPALREKYVTVTFYARIKDSVTPEQLVETYPDKKIPNDASYIINDNPDYGAKSNTVTVTPVETTLSFDKKWEGETAEDKAKRPTAEAFKNLLKLVKINTVTEKEETLSLLPTVTVDGDTYKVKWENLKVLENVVYAVREEAIDEYITSYTNTGANEDVTDKVFDGGTITNRKEYPDLEKYVNKNVTWDFENFDQVFTYDVMAYVTLDADTLTVKDTINSMLEIVGTNGNLKIADMGTDNDHKSTVAKDGIDITDKAAKATADGFNVEVIIEGLEEKDLRGHWIRVSFDACIKESAYATVAKLIADRTAEEIQATDDAVATSNKAWVEITDNGRVDIKEEHDGIPNRAHYEIKIADELAYELDSNTVTIEPKTTKVKVSKEWVLDGKTAQWPEGATVVVKLTKNGAPAKDSEGKEITVTLNKDLQTYTFENLPCLDGVTYGVAEGTVTNAGSYAIGAVEGDSENKGVFVITNKAETPSIEKYVNKKDAEPADKDNTVHTDLSFFDEVYAYDILAYVTKDAKYVVVTDQLKEVLDFADIDAFKVVAKNGSGEDGRTAPKLSDPATGDEVVYTVDFGTGTPGKLVVTIGSDKEDASVLDIAGKWLQITFYAKIKDAYRSIEALKDKGVTVWTTVTENVTDNGARTLNSADVTGEFSGATADSHEGIINDATYTINKKAGAELDNAWQYECKSNIVTVQPKTTELKVEKLWVDADGNSIAWPEDVTITVQLQSKKGEEAPADVTGKTLTLKKGKTSDSFTGLPCLEGVIYLVKETPTDVDGQVYTPTVEYNDDHTTATITNKPEKPEKPEIEKFVNKVQPHSDLKGWDSVFRYDVVVYVPTDAEKIYMTDDLKPELELVIDADHPVTATVADNSGIQTGETVTITTLDEGVNKGGKLYATISGISDSSEPVLRGRYVTFTFFAQIKEGADLSAYKDNDYKVPNDAKYIINDNPNYGDESNVVTVKPVFEDLTITKVWEGDKAEIRPAEEVFKANLKLTLGTQDVTGANADKLTITDNQDNTWTATWTGLKKYESKQYKVTEKEALAGYLAATYSEDGKTITNKATEPEIPEIEKYVNKQNATGTAKDGGVHTDLAAFDEVYTYDIQAYIAKDATVAEITDELKAVLEFVGEAPTAVVIKAGEEGGKAPKLSKAGAAPQDAWSIDKAAWKEGKLVLTLGKADSTEVLKAAGQWIQITFMAKIKDAYRSIEALKAAGENVWETIVNNDPIDDAKVDSHEGIANDASYRMKRAIFDVGNDWSYNDKSNTVTVEAETTEVEVSKEWKTGTLVDQWPAGATVEVKLTQTKDGVTTEVEGKTDKLTASKTKAIFADLPCLEGVTYGVAEGKVTNAGEYKIGEVKKVSEGVFKITNQREEEPEIEKYVNKKSASGTAKDGGVHTDLAAFDEVYTYDIQAYIAKDATVAEITDELKAVLEFVGEAPTAVVIKAGEEGGKAPKLSKAGAAPQDAWSIDKDAWKEGKLVLTLGKADSTEVLKAAGQWIQITFEAKIKDTFKSIDALKNAGADVWTTVVENDPIDDAKVDNDFSGAKVDSHEGIANDTSYRMKKAGVDVDNTWSYNDKSNTVTVQPKTTKLTVSKEWKTGTLVDQWPEGATVEVKLQSAKGSASAKDVEIDGKAVTFILDAEHQSYTFADLPCLEGVTYGVAEGKVTNAGEYKIGEVKKVSEGVFKITNQREEEPEIEKYVNKKSASGTAKDGGVHTDLAAFYEVYTYDIQAYIAKDATVAEITDELKAVLEFVGNGPTAVVIKAGEAYGKAPKLSKAGTAPKDAWSIDQEAWKAGKLVLTLGKADSTEVLKAAGQWIQITFDARIKDSFKSIDALKKAGADVWQTIVENDPIDDAKVDNAFSGAKVDKHEGIANDTSYRMKKAGVDVGNTWSYNDKSNTVTVQPKTVKVSVNKIWIGKPAEALRLALRRDGVIIETVTISAGSKWSYEWKSLPAGYKYEVTESVPANFTQTGSDTQVDKDGNVTVSLENTRTTTVKINKTDLGGTELAGAVIEVKDANGKVIATWTSEEGKTMDLNLVPGEYTFREVNAPEGYECVTTEIGFTVNGDGTVTVTTTTVEPAGAVEVIDGVIVLLDKVKEFPVKINKTDLGGTELAGAVIEVKDANGEVIATWTSEVGKTMDLNLVPGEYTFREVNAPEGYECVTTEIGFTVNGDGTVTVTTTTVEPAGAVEVIDGVIILKDELKKEEPTTEAEEEETDGTEPDDGGSLPPGDEDESTTVNAETESPSTEPETEPEGSLPPSDDEETTTVNAETSVPNTPPDTGDHSNLGLYIGLIAAAGVAGVGLLLATRKKKEEE